MRPTLQRCAALLLMLLALPVHADEATAVAEAPAAVSAIPQPASGNRAWDRLAFEVGVGWYNTQEEYVDEGPGYTLGLGSKVGDGVLLLRYTHQSNELSIAVSNLAFQGLYCEAFEQCQYKAVHYDEFSLFYREKMSIFSVGLGVGAVKRTVELQELVEISPDTYEVGTVAEYSTTRPAVFYELMAHIPINRRQKMSLGLGIQGQYNKDFPAYGAMLTFQKGL